MNRLVLMAALLGVLSSPRSVSASPPVPCPPVTGEVLNLLPRAALIDGVNLERSPRTGRFVSDAGLEFDMEQAKAVAELTAAMPGCEQPSGLVQLQIIDPFSNVTRQLTVEVRP